MTSRDIRAFYASSDALRLADSIRRGEVTPSELMEAAIAQAEDVNVHINAVVSRDYDRARFQARSSNPDSLFCGIPYLEKNYAVQVKGFRTTNGSKFLQRLAPVATEDSEAVRRLRIAGMIPFGMTNTPEMGLHWTTEPLAYGSTMNPWNFEYSPGGSSGGAAAAVAARIVPIAGGSDGAGSIRMPASACGLVGLKPSRGRVPPLRQGSSPHVSVLGCLSRSVRDTAAYLDAVAGPCHGDYFTPPKHVDTFLHLSERAPNSLRIGLVTSMPDGFKIDPQVSAWLNQTAHLLEGFGHRIEPCELRLSSDASRDASRRVSAVQLAQRLRHLERNLGSRIQADDLEPHTRSLMESSASVDAITFASDLETIGEQARVTAAQLATHDIVLCPVYPVRTPRLGEGAYDVWSPELSRAFGAYQSPINVCGVPAISLPVGTFDDGMPLGVQLVARYGEEATLLQVANTLEQQLRWEERRPPIAVQ